MPDKRLGWLDVSLDTRHGRIRSAWHYEGDAVRCEITTPVEAEITVGGKTKLVAPGNYTFWG